MSTHDWIRDSSTDKLRKIRGSYPPSTVEHRAVDEEIRRREGEEAKKETRERELQRQLRHEEESRAREIQDQKRHEELVLSQKYSSKHRGDDRWYKKIVIGIVVGVCVGLLLMFIKLLLGL